MLFKKNDGQRSTKLNKLTPSNTQKSESSKQPSVQTSFSQNFSLRSEKSTKYASQLQTPSLAQMDEPRALKLLFQQPEVLINKKSCKVRTQFIPTSNGMRFIMVLGETMINLSWLHTVQELEPGRILLLYYDLKGLGQGKVKLESLVLESGKTQGSVLCSALTLLHGKYHDEEVEKLYHFLC